MKNVETQVERIGQVVVLDPPKDEEKINGVDLSDNSGVSNTMLVFPSISLPVVELVDCEIAYLSPMLAFNLGLHLSCFNSLVRRGNEALAGLFIDNVRGETVEDVSENCVVNLGLETLDKVPRFASHLRVSFIKVPECGNLESLKTGSAIEADSRQEMIDLALQDYFAVDRFLAKGDVFRVRINWSCNSITCIPCNQRLDIRSDNVIYFKVNPYAHSWWW